MDYFTHLPVEQKLVLLVILIIVASVVFKTTLLVSIPYLVITLLTAWVGYECVREKQFYKHTCKKIAIKKRGGKESFDSSNVKELSKRESEQDEDERPYYKNIKLHGEENRSNSYPVTHLKEEPQYDDREITSYPFRMIEDENGTVTADYIQDDPNVELTEEKDEEIYEMYHPKGCSGDTMIAKRMSYMATMPKRAINTRARLDKYALAPYLEEELEQHANSIWWEQDSLEEQF